MAGNLNRRAIFAGCLHSIRFLNLNRSVPCDGSKRQSPDFSVVCGRQLSPFYKLGLGSTRGLKYNIAYGIELHAIGLGWQLSGTRPAQQERWNETSCCDFCVACGLFAAGGG